MKVFISGLTGTLGTSLARYHYQQGDTVAGIGRSESKIVQWLQDNSEVAEVFSCDVEDLVDSQRDEAYLLAHSDICYHCAALESEKQGLPVEGAYEGLLRFWRGSWCSLPGPPLRSR